MKQIIDHTFYLLYIFIVTSLFGYISGFCPTGCNCNTQTNGKTHLLCDSLNLKIFRVSNKSNTNIDSIDLSGNYLESMNGRKVSRFAPNIRILYLERNNFTQIHNETFEGFLHLNLLDLSNNEITDIDSNSFDYLINLKSLYLKSNKLQTVNKVWFQNLENLELVDLKNNLIVNFVPVYFQWPTNLKTLLLQNNSFHVLPPLPRNPHSVNISDNKVDCSCQRLGQEQVEKDVLLKVNVTCNKMSTETWRKEHWRNPNCTIPMVHVDYKESDDLHIIRCTGAGFPLPKVSLKHEGKVIATSLENPQVIYGLNKNTNVTCEVSNAVGINKLTINRTGPLKKVRINQQKVMDQDIPNPRLSTFSIVSYTVMFVLCSFSAIALIVSLYMFNLFFRQFHYTYETYVSI